MKKGYKENIENLTIANTDFRHVVYTGVHMQLVLMSLKPGEDIGLEIHEDNDQFFRFDAGEGKVLINSNEYEVGDGDAVIVPAGAEHNIINTSASEDLKLYTIYAPPHHQDGTIRANKSEALADSPDFDGQTTE